MRVQLVSGTNLFLQGLQSLLEKEQDFSLLQAMKCKSHCRQFCHVSECDVMVIDLSTGLHNSIDCIRQITTRNPCINILIIINKESYSQVNEAFKHGVKGVISMEANSLLFIDTIRTVADGRQFIEPGLAQTMAEAPFHGATNPFDTLSSRERTVLELMLKGHHGDSCAASLNISTKTVANHFTSIKKKLAVANLIELTRMAIRHALIKA